jgi:hypothetical protein
LAFIVTMNNRAVPQEAQFGMVVATQQPWIVRELASGHCSPFLNRIEETVRLKWEISDQFL